MTPLFSQHFIIERSLPSTLSNKAELVELIADILTKNNYMVTGTTGSVVKFEGLVKPVPRHEYNNYLDEGKLELTITEDGYLLNFQYFINYAPLIFVLLITLTIGILEAQRVLIIAALLIGYAVYHTQKQRRIASKMLLLILDVCRSKTK